MIITLHILITEDGVGVLYMILSGVILIIIHSFLLAGAAIGEVIGVVTGVAISDLLGDRLGAVIMDIIIDHHIEIWLLRLQETLSMDVARADPDLIQIIIIHPIQIDLITVT